MQRKLRFEPETPNDIGRALKWYDAISPVLGNQFREAVSECFDKIESQSRGFPRAFDDIYFVQVSRFPYLLLFREVGEVVLILGLFHSASNPDGWRKRAETN